MKMNYSFKLLIALFLLANLDIVGAAEDESGLSAAQALIDLRFSGRYLEPHLSSDHVSIQAEETDDGSEDEGEDLKGRFQCDECKKTFISNFSLKRHKIIHTGEKPYKCDQCGKSFTQSSNLKTHERVHAGDKPFQCGQCEKSFAQSSHLKSHERIHTGEKPYKCTKCEQSFSRNGDLKKHERVHSGDKPYQCNQCGKSFSDNSNFKRHQKIHAKQASQVQEDDHE